MNTNLSKKKVAVLCMIVVVCICTVLQMKQINALKTKINNEKHHENVLKANAQKTEIKNKVSSKENNIEKNISNNIENKPSKVAYLTFDDGPSENTSKILKILKENNIKATFFVNGYTSPLAISMYKKISKEGHIIGNHTYSHDYKYVYSSINNYINDTEKLNDLILKETGQKVNLIRFPGGSNNHLCWKYSGKDFMYKITKIMNEKGYIYCDWNVSSVDASAVTQKKDIITNAVLSGAQGRNHSIVLFHDSKIKTTTVEALPQIIEALKEQGYTFDVLSKDSFNTQFLK